MGKNGRKRRHDYYYDAAFHYTLASARSRELFRAIGRRYFSPLYAMMGGAR